MHRRPALRASWTSDCGRALDQPASVGEPPRMPTGRAGGSREAATGRPDALGVKRHPPMLMLGLPNLASFTPNPCGPISGNRTALYGPEAACPALLTAP